MKTFMLFCQMIDVPFLQVTPVVVISFIEYLVYNKLSHASIANYVSSLKTCFKNFNLSYHVFDHHWVSLALRRVSINVPVPLRAKGLFSIHHMYQIVQICDNIPLGFVY